MASKRGSSSEAIPLTYTGGTGLAVARVTADVLRAVVPVPDVVEVPAGGQALVRFRSPTGRAFRLISAAVNHPSLRAELATDGHSVVVALDPSVRSWESGLLQLTVTTDLPDEREVPVRVRVRTVSSSSPESR